MKLHTSDGSITFRAAAGTSMKDDWSMTTGDGGVALYLPSDFGAELDAHTGDGIDPQRAAVDTRKRDTTTPSAAR